MAAATTAAEIEFGAWGFVMIHIYSSPKCHY